MALLYGLVSSRISLLSCPIPMNIGTGWLFADLGDLSGKKATLTHIPTALTHISA
jgi:hypothetical protein